MSEAMQKDSFLLKWSGDQYIPTMTVWAIAKNLDDEFVYGTVVSGCWQALFHRVWLLCT